MNINSPKKRFGSPKSRMQNNTNGNPAIPTIVPPSLSNVVPKHNLGTADKTQESFNTYQNDLFLFNDQYNLDDDTLDMLNINLFDELFPENTSVPTEKNMDNFNEPPVISEPAKKPSTNKCETPVLNCKPSAREITIDESISSHMLTPFLLQWLEGLETKSRRGVPDSQNQVTSLIKFFVENKMDYPKTDNIITYFQQSDAAFSSKKIYKTSINNFFSWAESTGKYKDISKNIQLYEYFNPIAQRQDVCALDAGESSTSVCHTKEIETFFSNAINKRLQSLDTQFPEIEYKTEILCFMSFLIKHNILKPTNGTVVNYCRKSRKSNPRSFQILQDFFAWTKANGIYEDITLGMKLLCTVPLAVRGSRKKQL